MSFDRAALTYDQDFTRTSIAQWLRRRVWARLDRMFQPGMRVLEIGCGTGEDAVYLAQRGVQVVATDASPEMLRITQEKAQAHKLTIQTALFDLNQPDTRNLTDQFDGVYSNFGALNCTPHWAQLAAYLAQITTSQGKIGLGVMGRFCLWESLWHGLHGDFATAKRRWSGQSVAVLADGSMLPVYYPAYKHLAADFAQHFRHTACLGIGVFLPPSDVYPVVEARPSIQRLLTGLESRLGHSLPGLADHYWLELDKN